MNQTETTVTTTIRQALKAIRKDVVGETIINGLLYPTCEGDLWVRNAKGKTGDLLQGIFVAELLRRDRIAKTYRI